jgi:hypothetical protein
VVGKGKKTTRQALRPIWGAYVLTSHWQRHSHWDEKRRQDENSIVLVVGRGRRSADDERDEQIEDDDDHDDDLREDENEDERTILTRASALFPAGTGTDTDTSYCSVEMKGPRALGDISRRKR